MASNTTRSPLANISNTKPHLLPSVPGDCVENSKRRRKVADCRNMTGAWTSYEHLAFLQGLRLHGHGKWKKIANIIRTRDRMQVKTHGQYYWKLYENGANIFARLDAYYTNEQMQQQRAKRSRGGENSDDGTAMGLQPLRKRLRPPSDTIEAACALVDLSNFPRVYQSRHELLAPSYRYLPMQKAKYHYSAFPRLPFQPGRFGR